MTQSVAPTPDRSSGPPGSLRLRYTAVTDVGRHRKENQDSGYASERLLVVADGVGGAAYAQGRFECRRHDRRGETKGATGGAVGGSGKASLFARRPRARP